MLARLRRFLGRFDHAVPVGNASAAAAGDLIALGNFAEQAGRYAEACEHYRAALAIDPAEPYAHYNLGRLCYSRGDTASARTHLRSALHGKADFAEALIVLAAVQEAQGELPAAIDGLRQALRHRPRDFGALYHHGRLLAASGDPHGAEAALQAACAVDAENADANYLLATLLHGRGAFAEAEQRLRIVLRQQPEHDSARGALFNALYAQRRFEAALAGAADLLQRRPERADHWYAHGLALLALGRLDDAAASFWQVLRIDPSHALAFRMLGNALHRSARIDELVELLKTGSRRFPERFDLQSFELLALNFDDRVSAAELYREHRAFGERLEQAVSPLRGPFAASRDPQRRLRVAFVSGDLSYHPVALFLLPVLERLERAAFETVCYSSGATEDEFTRRLRRHADAWRSVGALPDRELAEALRRDEIDIAIDLAGHSGISRLVAFAHRPAPVQVSWLGYLNTTGLSCIDYRITDAYCDPPGSAERLHCERLLRLPRSQWCYRPFLESDVQVVPPCEKNGFITFGSFNQAAKISPTVRALWARLLRRLPSARLHVAGIPEGGATDRLRDDFAARGIDVERLVIRPHLPLADYYATFAEVDIALDTCPYSGGTTTFDALWMGVPVLTLPGERSASRSAASILGALGLREWIAASEEDYVRAAELHACDREGLALLRAGLRERLRESELTDEAAFARDFGQALRYAWTQWCAGR